MSGELRWPPERDDLERLYLVEKLSAAKIAGLYALKHPNPKSSETLVLYHLKKFGIRRRDRTAHIKKVTEEIASRWAKRYEAGESLKQIAGEEFSPVTVWNHLRKGNVALRDKIEELIKANTKHERARFAGDDSERAYIAGFAIGDCQVLRHGRAVRVRTSTTHSAMMRLFSELFGPYGFVHRYPRRSKLVGFEWSLEVDLDGSFAFLLRDCIVLVEENCSSEERFWSLLAGFFDAEGTIALHKKRGGLGPELFITNSNRRLLELLHRKITAFGFFAVLERRTQNPTRLGLYNRGVIWRLVIWRAGDVARLLHLLGLRHTEKTAKKNIALELRPGAHERERARIEEKWSSLIAKIREERNKVVQEAQDIVESKKRTAAEVKMDSHGEKIA